MVRSFPRHYPCPRAVARSLAAALLLARCAVAAARRRAADDLKDKKHKVEKKIAGAHDDLDESSAQLRAGRGRAGGRARTGSTPRRPTSRRPAASSPRPRSLDQQMQAKLDAAVARLEQARADLAAGRREDRRPAGRRSARSSCRTTRPGDPSLMGLSMVLTTQDPAELTGQLNSVQNVIDKESVVLDRLEASRALLTVQEQEVAAAKAEVAERAQGRRREPACASRGSRRRPRPPRRRSRSLVDAARPGAEPRPSKAKQADLAQLRSLQTEQHRIARGPQEARRRGPSPRRRRRTRGRPPSGPVLGDGGPVHSNGFLDYPVGGAGHLAVRLAHPPDLRLPLAARRHRLRRRLRHPDPRRRPPARCIEEYFQTAWGNRIIIDHGVHHGVGAGDDLQPPERLRGRAPASTSSAARSSGTSAPPAGPPAATCTSRCSQNGTPGRPDELVLTGRRDPGCARPERIDAMAKEEGHKLVAQNKKARHDYHIEDTYEAGMVLQGTEVKSLRAGRASLVDGFAEIDDHEVWLHGVHIPEYTQGTWTNHAARRKRKLLLNRAEIDKIERRVTERGLTDRAAVAVLQGRPRQGRDRAGQGQEDLRQAARARRAAGQPGGRAGARAGGSRACNGG